MASETLHFDNARQAQSLYANEPKNLRLVEDLFTSRSPPATAGSISKARRATSSAANPSSPNYNRRSPMARHSTTGIQPRGQRHLARRAAEDAGTPRGTRRRFHPQTADRAKTQGQKRYLEAIRKNDIVIGIGPAGTGKTYLAMAMAVHALRSDRVSRIILARLLSKREKRWDFCRGRWRRKSARICVRSTMHCMT